MGISKKLVVRLTRNARHVMREKGKNRHEEGLTVMQLITEPLRMELHFEIYSPSLSAHPFFSRYISACPYVTKRICHSALSTMHLAVGDIVFHAGEMPTKPRMFVVTNASLHYSQSLWKDATET